MANEGHVSIMQLVDSVFAAELNHRTAVPERFYRAGVIVYNHPEHLLSVCDRESVTYYGGMRKPQIYLAMGANTGKTALHQVYFLPNMEREIILRGDRGGRHHSRQEASRWTHRMTSLRPYSPS